MIFLPIERLNPGMTLAETIYIDSGCLPLVTTGQVLSSLMIERIRFKGISGVYIEADGCGDIIPKRLINDVTKAKALADIKNVFTDFSKTTQFMNASYKSVSNMAQNLVTEILSNDEVLINVLELKSHSNYTYNHSLSVAMISVVIGTRLELGESALKDLAMAALLHDIGKMLVPTEILDKPDRLTAAEFEIMKAHPANAYIMLGVNPEFSFQTLSAVRCHHEKYDGSGYPDGISGTDIPLFGRILAVADVYDAITSDRPYSKGCFPREAIEYMMGCADTHFESKILVAFLRSVAVYPSGMLVTLSDGRGAVVVKTFPENTLRPLVRILNQSGNCDVDLLHDSTCRNITISGMGYGEGHPVSPSDVLLEADCANYV